MLGAGTWAETDGGDADDASTEAALRSAAAAAEPDAFMSYAREDDAVAHAISDGLRAAGKEIWVDRERIPFASDWRGRARAGIDAAKAVIFVLSPHWLTSDACRYELEHAVRSQKRLVPVTVRADLLPDELPPALRDLVWIPASATDAAPAVQTLVATLDDDIAWRDMHARLLVRALEWESRDRDRSLLLRGTDLRDGEKWLTASGHHRETATPAHSAYIVASRRESARRQRIVLSLVAGALLVSLALAAVAYWQRAIAVDNEREAVAQRRVAVHNAHEARSRELAATATAQLDDDPERALLIGVEAAKQAPTVQAEEVLRAALPRVSGTRKLVHPGLQAVATDARDRIAVTGGTDGLARTWDLDSGRRLAVLRGHSPAQQTDVTQGVLSVAIAADGTLAATAGAEGDVRVWEPRTGRLRYVLHAPAGGPADFGVRVAFAGHGRDERLVTAGASGVVRTWDAATGRPRGAARLAGLEITELAVSPDGGRIAAAALPQLGAAAVVAVWDAQTLALRARLRTDAFQLAFGPDGRRLAATADRSVRVFDARTGTLERAFAADGFGGAAAFAPDGRTVAVAERGGRVALRDIGTGSRRIVLHHAGRVVAIAFSHDGSRLLTAGTDSTARLWDLDGGRLLKILRGHSSGIWYAAFLGDGQRVLTAGGDSAARIWRPALAPVNRELRGHRAVVDDIDLTPKGRRVVSVSEDGTARIWELRTGRTVARLDHGAGDGAPAAAVSPDGRLLLTSGAGPPRLWDAATGRALATLPRDTDGPAAFTPDGSLIVGSSGTVWDVRRRTPVGKVPAFLFEPIVGRRGGQSLVFETREDGTAFVAALPRGRMLAQLRGRFPRGAFVSAAFSPDGSILATEASDTTSLWDVRTGRRIGALPGTASLPPDQAFDQRGRRLLTIGETGVRVWDVKRMSLIADLPHAEPLGSAAFSRSGRLIVTASFDGFARVWEARTRRLVARFRGRTREEWNEGFVPRALFGPHDLTVVAATGGSSVFVGDCAICSPLHGLVTEAAQATSRRLTPDERQTYLGE